MARLNGTIDTDSYDVSAWRGYRGETGFTVGSRPMRRKFARIHYFRGEPTECSSAYGNI